MITIKSGLEPVARVLCSCCGDHYVTFERNKDFAFKEDEEVAFYFEFDDEDFWPLKLRIRHVFGLNKKKFEEYKSGLAQTNESLFITPDQLGELYSVLYNQCEVNNILGKEDIDYINSYSLKPKKLEEDRGWNTYLLFKSADGFVISLETFEKEKGSERLGDISLGWTFPDEMKYSDIKESKMRFLLKRSMYYFQKYDGTFNKNDMVKLLGTLRALSDSLKRENYFEHSVKL
jgi:hypothetical protein